MLLNDPQDLSEAEIIEAGNALISETVPFEDKRNFLLAWQERGERTDEVGHLANFFRKIATNPELEEYANRAIDIVGTGGDNAGTFNISTTTAIVVAAGGVPVIKHGNRSITSKTGAADLLESLGIPLTADPSLLKRSMQHNGFVFLFAPAFHPAFKSIVPIRKELAQRGKKTVFNILGPLINPAKPAFQLMGVFSSNWVEPLANTLTQIGVQRGLVAHSCYNGQSMDEITSIGKNTIAGVGSVTAKELDELQKLILSKSNGNLNQLKGGLAMENLNIFKSILSFEANDSLMNTICINAGAAFTLTKAVDSFEEGFSKAQELLKSGKVSKWVEQTRNFFKNES